MAGWIGVDLDGTLAHFDRWRGPMHIGLPIPAMAKRVHDWHARGVEIRIFTARASRPELIPDVQKWLQRNGFPPLAVTNEKDFGMIELWDDRAVQVLYNTGKAVRPNRLEETNKAELFDPDVVYVEDSEQSKEIQPSENEIESFKRNLKASADQKIHSLGDLLDALDEGEYAPGQMDLERDSNAPTAENNADSISSASPIETDLEFEALADDKPASTAEPVIDEDESSVRSQPKNSLVEIEFDTIDVDLSSDDEEISPELSDDATVEFKTISIGQENEEIKAIVADDGFGIPTDLAISTVSVESESKPLDDTLDNQPLSKKKSPAAENEDIDFGLMTALDDVLEDSNSPLLVTKNDEQLQRTPTLTAFPEDELDDFEDLPTFKVERR